MKPGTRIEMNALPAWFGVKPETGVIAKTKRENLPLPGPGWHIVKFDEDGAKLCVHESCFRVISNA